MIESFFKKRKILYLFVFVSLMLCIRTNMCSDEQVVAATSNIKITLNKNNLNLKVGSSEKLSVTVTNGSSSDLIWASNNKNVVTVDNSGNVKAVGVGSAYIIVVLKNNYNIRDVCSVTVTNNSSDNGNSNLIIEKKSSVNVSNISLNKSSMNMKKGAVDYLTVSVLPINATDKKVNWSSSNDKIVTVDNNGQVKAVGVGTAVINVSSVNNPNAKAKCSVTVTSSGDASNTKGAALILKNAKKYFGEIEKNRSNWKHCSNEKSRKASHCTTCCRIVSKILIKSGYQKRGYVCHVGKTSKPSGLNNLKKDKVHIYYNQSIKKLQPGDTVVYSKSGSKSGNIAIFGYKKNNDYYFYGASSGGEIREKKHPSKRMSGYWKGKSGKLTIIRAK